MVIHSLNLNEGGGVIPKTDVSAPEKDASVIIGIGGTGVDTIKILKKKIYSQLEPSNPGEAVPRYENISLIAIDSDEFSIGDTNSVTDISKNSEFISLKTTALAALLDPNSPVGLPSLKTNPVYNKWMSIDQIKPLLAEAGAGGIRQMGRFMLLQHAQEVYEKIRSAIYSAMEGMDSSGQVNIHIVAGISGGTGSGCFIDTCYLVRQVMEKNGWGGKIFGYFYLPDVVISKAAVAGDPTKSHLNRRNGYAAFRELDYLMDLEKANDWFDQSYSGAIPPIHTQKAPVDLCHLISASDASGNIPKEAYSYSINVVTDYIMAYLAHVELNGAVSGQDGGLTMQGHLANIIAGVESRNRITGAAKNYTVLGASNAEVPFSQIATYLAAGYYDKISSISDNAPEDSDINRFADKVGLVYDKMHRNITRQAPDSSVLALQLEEVDPKDCLDAVIKAATEHPQAILIPAEKWLENNKGRVQDIYRSLIKDLPSFDVPEQGQNNSYISAVHAALMSICQNADGKGGPGYAAKMLSRTGRDLVNVVDGLIAQNSEKLSFEYNQTQIESNLRFARDEFMHSNILTRKSKWDAYRAAMVRYMQHFAEINTLEKLDSVLHILKTQLQKLYSEFYQKLDNLCSSLEETFKQNATYLRNPDLVRQTNAYTWRIIQLDDVKDELDAILRNVVPETASQDLMNYLLDIKNQDEWLSESDYRIGRLVNGFMVEKFHEQLDKTVESYIRGMYPGMQDEMIVENIKTNILQEADKKAEPMFWKARAYTLNAATTFASSTMTVPSTSTLITTAANQFKMNNPHGYAIRESGIGDRIFALRFYSGIPLYAYQGVELMKDAYMSDLNGGLSGLHLFEHNTVLDNKKDKTEEDIRAIKKAAWGTYLPLPIPYSIAHRNDENLNDKEKENLEAYNKAKEAGVIRRNANNYWCIYINNCDADSLCGNSKQSFTSGNSFDYSKADECLKALESTLSQWTADASCTEFELLGSCPIVPSYEEAVLKDTFMRLPNLIQMVKDNVDAHDKLEKEIANIKKMTEEAGSEALKFQQFINALETGAIVQGIGKITYTYEEFGAPVELKLDSEPADLGPLFSIYKAYCGFKALDNIRTAEINAISDMKLNNLQEGDDEICKKYRQQLKTGISSIAAQTATMPAERKEEILKFYTSLRENLEIFAQQFPGYTPV